MTALPAGRSIDAGEKFVRRARQRFPALRFERGDALEDKALLPRLGDGAELLFIDIGGVREEPSVLEMINAAAKGAHTPGSLFNPLPTPLPLAVNSKP